MTNPKSLFSALLLAGCATAPIAVAGSPPALSVSAALGENIGSASAIGAGVDDLPTLSIPPGDTGRLLLLVRNNSSQAEAHDILMFARIDGSLPFVAAEVPTGRVFVSTSSGFDSIASPPPVDLGAVIGNPALPEDIDAPGNQHWQALDLAPPADPAAVTWVAAYVPRLASPFASQTGQPTSVMASITLRNPATGCADRVATLSGRIVVFASSAIGGTESALAVPLALADQEPIRSAGGIGARSVAVAQNLPDPLLLGAGPATVDVDHLVENTGVVALLGNRVRFQLPVIPADAGPQFPAVLDVDAGAGASVDLGQVASGVVDVHFAEFAAASARTIRLTLGFPACSTPGSRSFSVAYQGNDALCGLPLQQARSRSTALARDPAALGTLQAPPDQVAQIDVDRLLDPLAFGITLPAVIGLDAPSARIDHFGVDANDQFVLPELVEADAAPDGVVTLSETGFSRQIDVHWPALPAAAERTVHLALRMPEGVIAHPDYPFDVDIAAQVGACLGDRVEARTRLTLEGTPALAVATSSPLSTVEPGSELHFEAVAGNGGPVAAGTATLFMPVPARGVLLDVRDLDATQSEPDRVPIYCTAPPDDAALPPDLAGDPSAWPIDLREEYFSSVDGFLAEHGFEPAELDFETLRWRCPRGETTSWIAALLPGRPFDFLASGPAGSRRIALRLRNDEVRDEPNLIDQPSAPGTQVSARAAVQSQESMLVVGAPTVVTLGAAEGPTLDCSLPPASRGQPYSTTLQADGGKPPYVYAVEDGALPPGVALSEGGELDGTPDAPGVFDFRVRVTDSQAAAGTGDCLLRVVEPAVFGDGFEPRP